jgi:DDE family transposase
MEDSVDCYESLLHQGANRLTGHERRLFMAEVTLKLCDGNPRKAERRFGWGRETVAKGLHELQQGVRCLENFSARGRPRLEDKTPQLAQDIRAIVEPHTQADPELKSARRYSNLSAAEVLEALHTKKGYAKENLPSERTMRDILNRMNYRLKRIQKGKPLKKTPQTNAIFANVKAVKEEIKGPETLEISVDTKAKVNEGDYARGGKNPDGRGRQGCEGLGS